MCEGTFPKIVVQVVMALCDSNGDKHINENEFSAFFKILDECVSNKNNDAFIAALFKIADRNHDGVVEEKELKLLHKNMGWEVPLAKQKMNVDEFGAHVEKLLGIIDPEKEEMIEKAFKDLDLNKDGKITIEELLQVMKDEGAPIPESVLRTVFVLADADSNKSLDKKEVARLLRLLIAIDKQRLEEAIFNIADTNNDGVVERKEFQKICKLLGWEVPAAQKMNLEEFKDFVVKTLGLEKNWSNFNHYEYSD